jgi:hypothetical protein
MFTREQLNIRCAPFSATAASKVTVAGVPRERNRVADVLEPSADHDQALEAEAEARVWNGAEAPEVEVPLQRVLADADLRHAPLQVIDALLPLASADDLADARQQHVHRRDRLPAGLAAVVLPHVEALDGLGVIDDDNGALVHFVRQVALVLACEVGTPAFRFQNPLLLGFANDVHSFGVGQHGELLVHDLPQAREQPFTLLVEESDVFGAAIDRFLHAKLDEVDGVADVVADVGEGKLGLNHPELGQVLVRVGVLRPEGGSERVDGGQRAGVTAQRKSATR